MLYDKNGAYVKRDFFKKGNSSVDQTRASTIHNSEKLHQIAPIPLILSNVPEKKYFRRFEALKSDHPKQLKRC